MIIVSSDVQKQETEQTAEITVKRVVCLASSVIAPPSSDTSFILCFIIVITFVLWPLMSSPTFKLYKIWRKRGEKGINWFIHRKHCEGGSAVVKSQTTHFFACTVDKVKLVLILIRPHQTCLSVFLFFKMLQFLPSRIKVLEFSNSVSCFSQA